MSCRAKAMRVDSLAGFENPEDTHWNTAETLAINYFRPEGSGHCPATTLRLLHDNQSICGLFQVQDQFVRCTHAAYGDAVYRDSCVEFFVQPKAGLGYFNFEFNCGGAFLCNYITDPTRTPNGFKSFARLSGDDVKGVRVASSLPKIVEPEITEPVSWWLGFVIPVSVLEKFAGPTAPLSGQVWRANAYKCGDATSHVHWGAWSPVDACNFHLPRCFGELVFE